MKLTRTQRTTINQYARRVRSLPIFSHCEVAYRTAEASGHLSDAHMNLTHFGIWRPGIGETDLADFGPRLADLAEIEDHPSGHAVIDLYVYGRTRVGDEQQLDTNVQAVFHNGELVALGSGDDEVYFDHAGGEHKSWAKMAAWSVLHPSEEDRRRGDEMVERERRLGLKAEWLKPGEAWLIFGPPRPKDGG